MHKKYKSYEQAIADFNSTVNLIPSNKPSTSIFYGGIYNTKFGYELQKCCHYLPVCFGFCHVDEAEQLQKLLVTNSLVINLFS